MSEPVRRMLVAYDISNDARRDRVARKLEEFGERVQYSVFFVDGRPAMFVRLRADLQQTINLGTDTVLFCDLGARDTAARRAVTHIGSPRQLYGDADALIL